MKKWILLLPVLLLLAACGRDDAGASLPVDRVAVFSAREWNEFATAFNADRRAYADSITLEIKAPLRFDGMAFQALGSGFSGTILDATAAGDGGFYQIGQVEYPQLEEVAIHYAESRLLPPQADYRSEDARREYGLLAQRPQGLFGAYCDSLRLEGLSFGFVSDSGLQSLMADSVGVLEVVDVSIFSCHLPSGRSFLAANAGQLTVENLSIYRSGLYGEVWMAGLVRWVHGDVDLSGVTMDYVQAVLRPDLGGSGIGVGGVCLGADDIGGTASYRSLRFYRCTVTGVWSYLLSGSDESVAQCQDILVDHCALLALSREDSMFGPFLGDVLFRRMDKDSAADIRVWNTVAAVSRPWEAYGALGWSIHNCVTLTAEGYPYEEYAPY